MVLLIILLLLPGLLANNITSNIPTVVTATKNYTTSDPTWVTSPFFRAGNEQVIKDFTGSDQYPFASYTFIYSSALPGVPNLAYGIQRYRGNDYLGQEFYEIRQTALSATSFSVQIQIFGVTNLWILAVAYIAVDPTFPHHLNSFDNVPINYTAGNIVNISSKSDSLSYYTNYINYTQQATGRAFTKFTSPLTGNYIVIFMTSLWIQGTFGTLVQFHVYPQVVSESHYMWNITMYKKVLVTNVHFSELIFNSDDVESSKKYFIVFQKWYNGKDGGFISIPIEFVDNFIMGVTSFETTDAGCGFEYQWQFANKTINGASTFGVNMLLSWTVNNKCGFSWSQSSIFYMMTWSCQAPFYYFNLTSNKCQTLCGGYNFQNEADFTCDPCANQKCYQCQTFNSTACTDCASYLNYELSSGKCVCIPRHFATNDSCQHCSYGSTGCINCTYDDGNSGLDPYNSVFYACTECNNTQNYFLTGTSCTLCSLSNCVYCQNLTACAMCSPTYDYSDIQTCIKCLVTGCLNCSSTNTNICTTCDNSIGYYNNTTNNKCYSKCGDGIYVAADEGCDDGNFINYDGCDATCQVESSFNCSGSPSQCFFTADQLLTVDSQQMPSTPCNTITFGFRFTPPSDTFGLPNIIWENFLTSPNDSILRPNHTMSYYSSGVLYVSYFQLNHLQNQTLLFEADFSTILANSSIFNYTSAPVLTFTVSTNPEALMICCDGYYMAHGPIRCQQICGDGILYELPCDDGNVIDGDGCSSVCKVEKDYVCMNGSVTQPSICSYNGIFDIQLDTGDKMADSNSLVLTYDIYPALPLIVINNGSTDFTSMVSFPDNPAVTVIEATINPTTSKLEVKVGYSADLQDTELSMQITPPDTPWASLTPNTTSTWVVAPTNQLSAVVYTQEDYQTVQKITPFANTLLALYMLIALAAIVSRKFIGLQLAIFIQMSYLSLLHNKQITTYMQPVANWSSVFGYNDFHMSQLPLERFRSPYALFGYQIYFGFSNNMMVIVTGGIYGVALILLLASMLVSKAAERRLKNGAYLVASQVAYSFVVFGTPNLVTAICIQAQQGTITYTSLIWSKGLMLAACLMLIASHLLNLSTAQQMSDIGTYFRKHSKMGVYMPIIISAKLIAITTLLFVYFISPTVPSYMIIIIQLGYLMLIIFGRPHKKPLDTFRAICVEVGLLYVLVMRFTEVKVLAEYVQPGSVLYPAIAYIQYTMYSLGMVVSGVSIGYHLFKKIRGKKVGESGGREKEDGQSPQRALVNESMGQMNEPSPIKPQDQANPLIFDIEDMEVDIPQTSIMSLESKRLPRRNRAGGRWK